MKNSSDFTIKLTYLLRKIDFELIMRSLLCILFYVLIICMVEIYCFIVDPFALFF